MMVPPAELPSGPSDLRPVLANLGQGATCTVQLCRHSGTLYAVKRLDQARVKERGQVHQVLRERSALTELRHPFIVRLYMTTKDTSHLYFVLECVGGGELYKHIRASGGFAAHRARFYAAEVVLALRHIHSRGFVYRDLKASNVLLDEAGHAKLVDFGFARKLEAAGDGTLKPTTTYCGTPHAMAPEMVARSGHGQAVDWWGLGVLLYEMMVGSPPFPYYQQQRGSSEAKLELESRIASGANAVDFAALSSDPSATSLISALLITDASSRLGARGAPEVMAHPWWGSGAAGRPGAEPLRDLEDWDALAREAESPTEGAARPAPTFDGSLSELAAWREDEAAMAAVGGQRGFEDW